MNNIPSLFIINPNSHYMEPGTVAFIPGWIVLFITIIALALRFPHFFKKWGVISPLFLAVIVGSLIPALDDIFAFFFGPPFAHHSLFHSLIGTILTYISFKIMFPKSIAAFAFFGNMFHILFNYFLDYTTLFYPFTLKEFGFSDIIGIDTYWIKAIVYPLIFVLFVYSVTKYLISYKKSTP